MKTLQIITLSLLTMNFAMGQVKVDRPFFDSIEVNYTTRWDIEKTLGKGQYLEKEILNPDNENNLGKPGWVHRNGLLYPLLGITFICAEDGEQISGVELKKPYKGWFGHTYFEIGKTKLGTIFPNIDTCKVTTTKASNYWSFESDGCFFYVKKTKADKAKYYFQSFEKNSFKDNLVYYNNQPVDIISLSFHQEGPLENEPITNNLEQQCVRPMYMPKTEIHLNCFNKGWPKSLTWIEIPFYALTGGSKSEEVKEGYWKEYSSKHLLIYEGEYKNNKKVGIFKYYDQNGKLKRIEDYSYSTLKWIIPIILLIGLFTILIVRMNRKTLNKNQDLFLPLD